MKLYLSSYRVPTPDDLADLLGKPLDQTTVALIPNAKDYYAGRAHAFKVQRMIDYLEALGMTVTVVDLRDYNDPAALKSALAGNNLVWAMGGNTYILRYEMQRSGFDIAIRELLDAGVVYGGDSAGAMVAGASIDGIQSADEPEFAEQVITDGMQLVPFTVLPHVDNPEFTEAVKVVRGMHKTKTTLVELKDSQAVVCAEGNHRVATGPAPTSFE